MKRSKQRSLEFSETSSKAHRFHNRWKNLCERYLTVSSEDSFWRYNRKSRAGEPPQGWKLHVSATILEACELFERVADYLVSEDVQFKTPKSLNELSKLNSGLDYGYWQVGKFITVYPVTDKQAVRLARQLHELTAEFVPLTVPFDEQYLPESSVFYRYGAFSPLEMTDKNGRKVLAIKNPAGEMVADDKFRAFPEWIKNPFQKGKPQTERSFENTPLGTDYKIFRAITQRGKGGTYQAFAFIGNLPQLCIVKEGRRHGEVNWDGQDGYALVQNEFKVLNALGKKNKDVPQVLANFEVFGNFYLVMEFVEGRSLHNLMKFRRRRFSVRQVIVFALEITKIIEKLHQAGWVWNDCKPSNIIVTKDKLLRPIDFEGAYRTNETATFDWNTKGFTKAANGSAKSDGKREDIYALGAVIYFLLTGKLYDADAPLPIQKLRRRVPQNLVEITEKLVSESELNIGAVRKEFESLI